MSKLLFRFVQKEKQFLAFNEDMHIFSFKILCDTYDFQA